MKASIIFTTKVDHQALNQWTITVLKMNSMQVTLTDKGLGRYQGQPHDQGQDQYHNHLPDQDHRILQCQETAHQIQVQSDLRTQNKINKYLKWPFEHVMFNKK